MRKTILNGFGARLLPNIIQHPSGRILIASRATTFPSSRTCTTSLKNPLPRQAMSSDADYEAFLNKANEDPKGNVSTQSKSKSTGITSVDTIVPKSLEQVNEVFVSDADEPFEPISLKFESSSLPSTKELSKLVGVSAHEIGEKEFDPHGQYSSVIEVVKDAGNGKVAFFKVKHDSTRIEYLIVSVDVENKRLVGMKALSIES